MFTDQGAVVADGEPDAGAARVTALARAGAEIAFTDFEAGACPVDGVLSLAAAQGA